VTSDLRHPPQWFVRSEDVAGACPTDLAGQGEKLLITAADR
jgi:hypothetical protein